MGIINPKQYINILGAATSPAIAGRRVLLVGQKTAAGTAISGEVVLNLDNDNGQDALFGENSMLARMVRAFKEYNKNTEVDAIPLSDFAPSLLAHSQDFISDTGFTYNATYTYFTGSRMEQVDQGGGSYNEDIITCPLGVVGAVNDYVSFTATDDGTIRYIIDGQYWNGSAWVASSDTWATSSPASDISTNITTLIPIGTDILLKVATETGAVQQWVSDVDITYHAVAAAVAASGTVAFSGTASAAGSIYVTVGSHKNHRYKIDISSAETATSIGNKLEAAINADSKSPVTASNTVGSVAINAVNLGEEGNFITIKVDGSVAGITITLTAMSSGATNPVLTGILTQLANIRYTEIVFPETYDIDTFVDFQEARFNTGTYRILDGIAITCLTDTKANFLTFTDAVNKKTAVLMVNKPVATTYHKGSAIVELDYVNASKLAAISSLRLTEDADISNFIIANDNPSDANGGIGISTLPFFNTPFYDLTPASPVNFWTDTEIDELTTAGFTVFGNNTANNEVILNDVVTRYKTNAGGDPDLSFKYLNYLQQSSVFREYMYSVFDNAFKQSRLTTGILVNGRAMANADVIAAVAIRAYAYLADQAVCPKGADKSKAFADSLVVTITLEEGKASVQMLDPVVTQLRRINTTISMDFSI